MLCPKGGWVLIHLKSLVFQNHYLSLSCCLWMLTYLFLWVVQTSASLWIHVYLLQKNLKGPGGGSRAWVLQSARGQFGGPSQGHWYQGPDSSYPSWPLFETDRWKLTSKGRASFGGAESTHTGSVHIRELITTHSLVRSYPVEGLTAVHFSRTIW